MRPSARVITLVAASALVCDSWAGLGTGFLLGLTLGQWVSVGLALG